MHQTKQKKIEFVESHWYRRSLSWLTLFLLPFSWLFRLLVSIRYFFYRINFKKKYSFKVPVIVVGNISVGGTGKTPFVVWLAEVIQKKGYRPGIVSRGMGGEVLTQPYWVDGNAKPEQVGDEALLLARRTHCPMVVCVDRVAAVQELLQKTNCNIVISDDGLQHYRLARDVEIVLVDGMREFGNSQMLPAGPLREPLKRLRSVDFIVINGHSELAHSAFKKRHHDQMSLSGDVLFSLLHPNEHVSLKTFENKSVHAIAGIGNPERFFNYLRNQHINIIEHVFPDHYLYKKDDIYFADNLPVIMTEKDAVKCFGFADQRHWCLPVQAQMSLEFETKLFKSFSSFDFKNIKALGPGQKHAGMTKNGG